MNQEADGRVSFAMFDENGHLQQYVYVNYYDWLDIKSPSGEFLVLPDGWTLRSRDGRIVYPVSDQDEGKEPGELLCEAPPDPSPQGSFLLLAANTLEEIAENFTDLARILKRIDYLESLREPAFFSMNRE